MDELRDWVFSWCCIAHSCSRALKWGLRDLVLSEDMLVDVHVSMSSLLRASTGLMMAVPQLFSSFVAFDRPPLDNEGEVEFLWSFLDVPPLTSVCFCGLTLGMMDGCSMSALLWHLTGAALMLWALLFSTVCAGWTSHRRGGPKSGLAADSTFDHLLSGLMPLWTSLAKMAVFRGGI